MDEMDDADMAGIVSLTDAAEIGFRVVEMADRVKVGHACLPGSKARWHFEMDGTRYTVDISVADPESVVAP